MRHVENLAGAAALLAIGGLIGAVTAYQWFDIKLTEGSGDLLGAAFGSMLAVGGAAWLSGLSERRRNRQAKLALRHTYQDLLIAMDDLAKQLHQPFDKFRGKDFADHRQFVIDANNDVQSRLKLMTPAFQAQGLAGVMIYNELAGLAEVARDMTYDTDPAFNARSEEDLVKVREEFILKLMKYHESLHVIVESLP